MSLVLGVGGSLSGGNLEIPHSVKKSKHQVTFSPYRLVAGGLFTVGGLRDISTETEVIIITVDGHAPSTHLC